MTRTATIDRFGERSVTRRSGATVHDILLISYYQEDTRTLLRVVDTLAQKTQVRPISLLTAQGPERESAVRVLKERAVELYEELSEQDADVVGHAYNPFYHTYLLRKASIAVSQRILQRIRPRAILCTNNFLGGHFLRAARRLGIPSLGVLWTHVGTPEFHRAWSKAETRASDAEARPLVRLRRKVRRALYRLAGLGQQSWAPLMPVTCLALPGPFYRDVCLRAGLPAERLVVTGNIQCDDMYRCSQLDAATLADVRRSVGVPPDRPYLLYAVEHVARLHHLSPESGRDAMATILRAMRTAFPELPRVVKLHPKQGDDDRARIQSVDPHAIVLQESRGIGELVAAAGVVVSTISSSLLWAVGIDRPAISAYFWQGVDEQRALRMKQGVEHADTFDALVTALRNNVENPEHVAQWQARRAAAREVFLRVDGHSADRIAMKLLSLLS